MEKKEAKEQNHETKGQKRRTALMLLSVSYSAGLVCSGQRQTRPPFGQQQRLHLGLEQPGQRGQMGGARDLQQQGQWTKGEGPEEEEETGRETKTNGEEGVGRSMDKEEKDRWDRRKRPFGKLRVGQGLTDCLSV